MHKCCSYHKDNNNLSIETVIRNILDDQINDFENNLLGLNSLIDSLNNKANNSEEQFNNFLNEFNTFNITFNSVLEMEENITSLHGTKAFLKGYYDGSFIGGGFFTYDRTKRLINNGGTIINGWVRQYDGKNIAAEWFGIKYDGTDEKDAVNKLMEVSAYKTIVFSGEQLITSDQLTMKKGCTLDLNGCHIIGKHKVGKPVGQRDVIALNEDTTVKNGTVELFYDSHNNPDDSGFGAVIGIGIMSDSSEHSTYIKLDNLTILSDGMSLNGLKLMGDITNVEVSNITFPDNDMLGIPIITHWTGDNKGPDNKPLITAHPKNVVIKNINFGHMKPTEHPKLAGYDALSLIFISSSSNVIIDNVYCKSTEHKQGVLTVYCGDYHGVYSDILSYERIINSGIKVTNIIAEYVKHRFIYLYGRGIYEQQLWTQGVIKFNNISATCDTVDNLYAGLYVRHVIGAIFENVNIKGGANSVRFAEGCVNCIIKDSYLSNSKYACLSINTPSDKIDNVVVDNVTTTSRQTTGGLIEIKTGQDCVIKNCNVGSIDDSGLATTGIKVFETAERVKILDNNVVGLTNGDGYPTGFELGTTDSDDTVCSLFKGNTVNEDITYYQRGMSYPIYNIKLKASLKIRESMSNSAPDKFRWNRGDKIYNYYPTASGHEGWICIESGTPGSWKKFGNIET